MKEIIAKPNCVGCGKPIHKPKDCDMELFRLGYPVHLTCLGIYRKVQTIFRGSSVEHGDV